MVKIGILSDTHGVLPDAVLTHLEQCDEIWHAGDIGSRSVLDELEALKKKVRTCIGNIDSKAVFPEIATNNFFTVDGVNVLLRHICGNPPRYNSETIELLAKNRVDMVVCGHSHILKVQHVPQHNLLHINPGALGNHGFHQIRTMILLDIHNGKPQNLRIVELGTRGNG